MLISPLSTESSRLRHNLRSEYVEACWTSVLGAGSVAFLRLCPALWSERIPAEIEDNALAAMIGLGSARKLHRIAQRLDGFGLAVWRPDAGSLDVFIQLPDLSPNALSRSGQWVRDRHFCLGGVSQPAETPA